MLAAETYSENKSALRMYIVVNDELQGRMPFSKALVQAGHAIDRALEIAERTRPEVVALYRGNGLYKKVTVKAKNIASMERIIAECGAAEIPAFQVIDHGLTVFNGVHTPTYIGIGPCLQEELPKYVQRLQLLPEDYQP